MDPATGLAQVRQHMLSVRRKLTVLLRRLWKHELCTTHQMQQVPRTQSRSTNVCEVKNIQAASAQSR